jgi:hypothetical protein
VLSSADLTANAVLPAAGCTAGQTETRTLAKQ